jgi:hypothetical protein
MREEEDGTGGRKLVPAASLAKPRARLPRRISTRRVLSVRHEATHVFASPAKKIRTLFDIADQQGNQIENGTVTVTEVFSNIKVPPGPTPATVSVPLSTNGVTDNQAYGFTYPTCLATNQNQALNMTWTVKVGSTVYPVTTLLYITLGNFSGTDNVTSTITIP